VCFLLLKHSPSATSGFPERTAYFCLRIDSTPFPDRVHRIKSSLKIRVGRVKLAGISTPISISLADHLTSEEREQILQTIEMFEVITQANVDDYQSLEILKEAYWKLGRQQDGLAVTRKLADAYMRLGQYSSAMLEYEGILQQEPNSREVQTILSDLEAKLHQGKSVGQKGAAIALDFGIPDPQPIEVPAPAGPTPPRARPAAPVVMPAAALEPNLIATSSTTGMRYAAHKRQVRETSLENDGLEPLAKFLLQHRLASHEIVNASVLKVRKHNAALAETGQGLAASLLEEICQAGVDAATLLCGIIDRTKSAYIPLEYYDVDRQVVKMLPEYLTVGRLIVPFDIVSRTMMVAAANPFDIAARNAVQQAVDYHIQWHLAMPGVIRKILRDVYRIVDAS